MFDIQKKISSLTIGKKIDSVTGVIIHTGLNDGGEDITYSAGNSSGYVIEVNCPSGTQDIADNMLSVLKLRGYNYQPFEARDAIIDPACEIGDAVTVNGVKSIIFSRGTDHARLMLSGISAPYSEEVDHEFSYVPRQEREFKRESSYARSRISQTEQQISLEVIRATDSENAINSRLTVAEGNISAKVSKTGGSASSFGWTLTDSEWKLTSGNTDVLVANSSGISVNGSGTFSGTITATGGTVGGWDITDTTIIKQDSTHIVYLSAPNSPTDTNIAMAVRTKVDNAWTYQYYIRYSGELYAKNATIEGKVTATSGTIGGVTIENGVLSGITDTNIARGGISGGGGYGSIAVGSLFGGNGGDIGSSTVTTFNTISGINTNLGFAAGYGAAIVSGTSSYPSVFNCGTLFVKTGISAIGTGGATFATDLTVQAGHDLTVTGNSTLQLITGASSFNAWGYGVSWKSLRYVSDIIGGVPEYATVYYLGR